MPVTARAPKGMPVTARAPGAQPGRQGEGASFRDLDPKMGGAAASGFQGENAQLFSGWRLADLQNSILGSRSQGGQCELAGRADGNPDSKIIVPETRAF